MNVHVCALCVEGERETQRDGMKEIMRDEKKDCLSYIIKGGTFLKTIFLGLILSKAWKH